MKSKEEILKSYGITETTKHHEYSYLWDSMLDAMERYAEQKLNKHNVSGSVCGFYIAGMDTSGRCNNCGKMPHEHNLAN